MLVKHVKRLDGTTHCDQNILFWVDCVMVMVEISPIIYELPKHLSDFAIRYHAYLYFTDLKTRACRISS